MPRRSSPAPLLVQNPHHLTNTSPLNPFHVSLSPTPVSRLEPLLEEPPYMGRFTAGGGRGDGIGSGDNDEEHYHVQVRS
ncbi:hypothetical protein IMY05_010G0165300 [Salix suchowensis]|nr:hypothetical protein IMY05_010G0165300 [Salix suchowensis]